MRGRSSRALACAVLGLACGGCALTPRPPPAPAVERISIVAAERGPRGIRLVAIDEHGDRRFTLIAAVDGITRDSNPAISPDGRWLVFASTRDRAPKDGVSSPDPRASGTGLWIAPLGKDATPRRLTDPSSVDQHPVWAADGRSIVFSSTREGGDFDLWRLPIDAAGNPGTAVQLTTGPGHEVTPTLAPDGTIVYAAVTQREGLEVESHLEERAPDGAIRKLTAGPADGSPSLSPDGKSLVFSRPTMHRQSFHSELFVIENGAWRSRSDMVPATQLVELPITDESGPVWSRDGRFLFATSVLRGANGKPVFSSIVHVDLQERTRRVRILEDRAGAIVRLSPAIRSEHLDAAALHSDPEYLPELARIMAAAIAEQTQK
jgi:Tol biopolymer transport system component